MAYGVRYRLQFTSLNGTAVRCDILEKNYNGSIADVKGGNRSPLVIEYDDGDDLLSPIVGSRAVLSLIGNSNFNTNTFIDTDPYKWQLKVYKNNVIYYNGVFTAEDSYTPMIGVDFVFTLNFTDQLSALKDKDWDKTEISASGNIDISLAAWVSQILRLTTLELGIGIYINHFPLAINNAVGSWFTEVYMLKHFGYDAEAKPRSCFDILTEICISFQARIFQARGRWNIVSVTNYAGYTSSNAPWLDGGIISYTLDSNVIDKIDTPLTDFIPVNNSLIFTSLKRIKKIENTFNYLAPAQLLNLNLQKVGAFVGTTYGLETRIDRYEIFEWQKQNNKQAWIEVEIDLLTKKEVGRWLLIPWESFEPGVVSPGGVMPKALVTPLFLVEAGDKLNLSYNFSATADNNNTERSWVTFYYENDIGNIKRALRVLPNQNADLVKLVFTAPGGLFNINNIFGVASSIIQRRTDNKSSASFDFLRLLDNIATRKELPFIEHNANARIAFFGTANQNPALANLDLRIQDIKLDYQFWINKSRETTGQTHTAVAFNANEGSVETRVIYIDDSPRILPKGSLYVFLPDRVKTSITRWEKYRGAQGIFADMTLQELCTMAELNCRGIDRRKLSGTIRKASGSVDYLDIINPVFDSTRIYMQGRVRYDIKNELVEGTFYEVENTAGTLTPVEKHEFNYLYKPLER